MTRSVREILNQRAHDIRHALLDHTLRAERILINKGNTYRFSETKETQARRFRLENKFLGRTPHSTVALLYADTEKIKSK